MLHYVNLGYFQCVITQGREQGFQLFFRNFLVEQEWRLWRHALFLLLLLIQFAPEMVMAVDAYSQHALPTAHTIAALYICSVVSAIALIYFNAYWLLPRFLLKKKFTLYVSFTSLELIADFIITYSIQQQLSQLTNSKLTDLSSLYNFHSVPALLEAVTIPVVFLGAVLSGLLFREWILQEERARQLEQIRMHEEINQLKSQVNPHFLFNTLNNIITLIELDAVKATIITQGLADILRYNLYETSVEDVLLSREIEVQQQLLTIEQIRRHRFSCRVDVEGDCEGVRVPPYLFINFVENAIKHSRDDLHPSFVNVLFNRGMEAVKFTCRNSVGHGAHNQPGGLGLANVKRRLELIYGKTHMLQTRQKDNYFEVTLTIPL